MSHRHQKTSPRDPGSSFHSQEQRGKGLAYIIPSDISNLALAGCNDPELVTLDRLKRELPRKYVVFHSVHWTREYKGNTAFGEADFVVLNPAGKGLVIEQKNGRLEESGDGLVKRYEHGQSDPFFQVRRSVDKMKEKFKLVHRTDESLNLDYLVYCPDHQIRSANAVGFDMSRIVDAASDDQLVQKIEALLGLEDDAGEFRKKVEDFFHQSFEVFADIHAHQRAGERTFSRLSGGLVEVLSKIEMEPMRLRVRGAPGSGKTVVAQSFFERAVSTGRRPLLVCFNRPLAEKIKAACSSGGLVETWYGLCHRFLESKGEKLDFANANEPNFWNDVQDLVVSTEITDDWMFDVLIVDEGQDFEQEWFDILRLFLREDGDILWLEDGDQGIRQRPPVLLSDFVGYRASANYRSPESIARFMLKSLPFEFELANDLPGLGVSVHRYPTPADQSKIVAKIITDLLAKGFRPEDIVILSLRGINSASFSEQKRIGNYTLKRFNNEYDLLGNQVFTPGQILLETIYRYKGQQAPAIIVVDVETKPGNQSATEQLLYASFSRATVRLDVVVPSEDALANRLMTALS